MPICNNVSLIFFYLEVSCTTALYVSSYFLKDVYFVKMNDVFLDSVQPLIYNFNGHYPKINHLW